MHLSGLSPDLRFSTRSRRKLVTSFSMFLSLLLSWTSSMATGRVMAIMEMAKPKAGSLPALRLSKSLSRAGTCSRNGMVKINKFTS